MIKSKKDLKKICCITLLLLLCLTGCGKKETQFSTVEDLAGKTIAAKKGTIHSAVIKKTPELADAEILYADSSADGLAMLFSGKVDALADDYVTAKVMTGRYNGILLLDKSLDDSVYGFAFSKNHALIPLFNKTIAELNRDGTIPGLVQKWMDDTERVKSVPEQTWPGSNGVIRCRVCADIEPMCYIDTAGNLVGFDIDLILNIAEKLDYKVEFSEGNFDDLIPSVSAEQIDMAASGITITPERSEMVDFTDGYLEAGTVILVRDVSVGTERMGLWLSLKNSISRTLLEENRWQDLLAGLWMSIKIIILSLAAGALFGTLIYLWYYSGSRIAKIVSDMISMIMLYLPTSTWLMVVFYLIFAGNDINNFGAAIFAFGFSFGFDVFVSLKGAIGAIDSGQVDAAVSMGYGRYEALSHIYIPQALPDVLSSLESAVIVLIRCTSLVEFIAVQDIQEVADRIRAESFDPFMPIILTAVVYVLLALCGSWLVRKLRLRFCHPEMTESELKQKLMKEIGQ